MFLFKRMKNIDVRRLRKMKKWSYGQLAHLLDAGHAYRWLDAGVCLWITRIGLPRQRYMSRIIELTKGEVQPNDFFIERG